MLARDIANALGTEVRGDGDREITRVIAPDDRTEPGDLALAMTADSLAALARSPAQAIVVRSGAKLPRQDYAVVLEVADGRRALATLTGLFDRRRAFHPGVHASAIVAATAELGAGVGVGPLAVVGDGAVIGEGTEIGAQVTIGAQVLIGSRCSIRPGARIGDGTRIGDRVVVHENAAIGVDGFSFVTPRELGGEALPVKIASVGAVRICDDVEIGAGSAVDRATLAETVIGRGTKIDNLVQIAHNVRIGEACLIAGQVGIAGSAVIGDRVLIGGGAGIADHVTVGSDAVIFAGSGVGTNVPDGGMVSGYPAIPHRRSAELQLFLGRHKRLTARIEALAARLDGLEGKNSVTNNDLAAAGGAAS